MPYNFIKISKKNKKVKTAYAQLNQLIKDIKKELNDDITFDYRPIGSYSRNMMTYDSNSNVGFDFDINIISLNYKKKVYSAKVTKEKFIDAINKHAKKYGYSYAENSTRVITIKVKDTKNSKILHSVDFAIIRNRENAYGDYWQEYIRFNKKNNVYNWSKQKVDYKVFEKRMNYIESEKLDNELWEMYLQIKNNNKIESKHSILLLTEAVNNIYNIYYEETETIDKGYQTLVESNSKNSFSSNTSISSLLW